MLFCGKYRVRTFYMVASVILLCSCHSQADKDVLAEVGDAVLYANEVSFSVPKGLTPKDSLLAAKKYVHDWVVDQMMLQEAESKVDSSDQIDEMVDEYRRSLYIYAYQKQMLEANVQQTVSDEEVADFYSKNKESLLLSETILKGFYVVMPAQSHELGDMRKAMSAKEMDKVESIAVKNGAVTSYFTDGWKPVSELRKNGFLSLNTNGNYPSDHLFTFSEDGKVYMLFVVESARAGAVQPLDYASMQIRMMLMEQRKQAYLSRLRSSLYQKAIKQGQVSK